MKIKCVKNIFLRPFFVSSKITEISGPRWITHPARRWDTIIGSKIISSVKFALIRPSRGARGLFEKTTLDIVLFLRLIAPALKFAIIRHVHVSGSLDIVTTSGPYLFLSRKSTIIEAFYVGVTCHLKIELWLHFSFPIKLLMQTYSFSSHSKKNFYLTVNLCTENFLLITHSLTHIDALLPKRLQITNLKLFHVIHDIIPKLRNSRTLFLSTLVIYVYNVAYVSNSILLSIELLIFDNRYWYIMN